MTKRLKTYDYLSNDSDKNNKRKYKKKSVTKRKRKFEDYKNCLAGTQPEYKINYLK